MRLLKPGIDLDGFFDRLALVPARALVLDYDGTLAPFREERDSALPYPGVREVLAAIQESGRTLLVVVSGRPAKALEGLLGLFPAPETWGSHGRERTRSGCRQAPGELSEEDRRAVTGLEEWIASAAGDSALERKPFGVAIHWRDRGPDEADRLRRLAVERFQAAVEGTALEVLEFDGGVEVRPRGDHKGVVIEKLLEELPSGAAVACLGDDRTDEDAFAALAGRGLSVLVRPVFRETAADVWIEPPEELLAFLHRWLEAS
jgi:trehalose-phosphatase